MMFSTKLSPTLFLASSALLFACGGEDDKPAGPAPVTTKPTALHLNDLSVLFPLPPVGGGQNLLLSTRSAGAKGALLPESLYQTIPHLASREDRTALYDELHVVAARFDPCFKSEIASTTCEPQVRLVFQPVVEQFEEVTTLDAAIHVFYRLDTDGFAALLTELRALKAHAPESTATAPLGVHPTMAAEGLEGTFATALKTILLKYAGADNLRRATFMRVTGLNNAQWQFGGFEVENGVATVLPIAGVDTATQTFNNIFVFSEEDFVATVSPESEPADDITVLYNSTLAREASMQAIETAFTAAIRIENPANHTPDSIDCVSCHVATGAKLWVERNFEQLTSDEHPDRFQSTYNLTLTSETTERTAALRAFGWFATSPSISQRTVNETAAIAEALNR